MPEWLLESEFDPLLGCARTGFDGELAARAGLVLQREVVAAGGKVQVEAAVLGDEALAVAHERPIRSVDDAMLDPEVAARRFGELHADPGGEAGARSQRHGVVQAGFDRHASVDEVEARAGAEHSDRARGDCGVGIESQRVVAPSLGVGVVRTGFVVEADVEVLRAERAAVREFDADLEFRVRWDLECGDFEALVRCEFEGSWFEVGGTLPAVGQAQGPGPGREWSDLEATGPDVDRGVRRAPELVADGDNGVARRRSAGWRLRRRGKRVRRRGCARQGCGRGQPGTAAVDGELR